MKSTIENVDKFGKSLNQYESELTALQNQAFKNRRKIKEQNREIGSLKRKIEELSSLIGKNVSSREGYEAESSQKSDEVGATKYSPHRRGANDFAEEIGKNIFQNSSFTNTTTLTDSPEFNQGSDKKKPHILNQIHSSDEAEIDDHGDDSNAEMDHTSNQYITEIGDPLVFIDPDADLDAILGAKSIREAIELLCPMLPGIPTKARGKYKKRRLLNANEKEEVMKIQNRENANRTRLRKKIYEHFLTSVIIKIEEKLYPDTAKDYRRLVTSGAFAPRLQDRKRKSNGSGENSHEIINTGIAQQRFHYIKKFLKMRCSTNPKLEKWGDVVCIDVVYSIPYPSHRTVSKLGIVRERYECHGIEALIDETEQRRKFINNSLTYPLRDNWLVDIDVSMEDVAFGASGNTISFPYHVVLYEPLANAPIDATTSSSPVSSNKSLLCKIAIFCKATFAADGKISMVHENFDSQDIAAKAAQVRQNLQSSKGIPPSIDQIDAKTTAALMDARLDTVRKFTTMRFSGNPHEHDWDLVCTPDIVHILPYPVHRKVSALGLVRDVYECRGLDAIKDDTLLRKEFFSSYIQRITPGLSTWLVDIKIRAADSSLNSNGKVAKACYNFYLYLVPLLKNKTPVDKSLWSIALNVSIWSEAVFNDDGKILIFREKFDANDILRQVTEASNKYADGLSNALGRQGQGGLYSGFGPFKLSEQMLPSFSNGSIPPHLSFNLSNINSPSAGLNFNNPPFFNQMMHSYHNGNINANSQSQRAMMQHLQNTVGNSSLNMPPHLQGMYFGGPSTGQYPPFFPPSPVLLGNHRNGNAGNGRPFFDNSNPWALNSNGKPFKYENRDMESAKPEEKTSAFDLSMLEKSGVGGTPSADNATELTSSNEGNNLGNGRVKVKTEGNFHATTTNGSDSGSFFKMSDTPESL